MKAFLQAAVRAKLERRHGELVDAAWKHAEDNNELSNNLLMSLGIVALWQAKISTAPPGELERISKELDMDIVVGIPNSSACPTCGK